MDHHALSGRTLLVDAPIYVFRAYCSLPASITDLSGHPVNALHGFARFVAGLLEDPAPRRMLMAFDESLDSSFRNEIHPGYKASRPPAPPELAEQFARCRALCRLLGIPEIADPRFEADDLIGSAARCEADRGIACAVVSRDKDLLQLVDDAQTLFWDGLSGPVLDADAVYAQRGVAPDRIADWLALVGDRVDDIPGVPGVGDASARALLSRFDSLDGIYRALDEIAGLPLRGASRLQRRLAEHEQQARMSQALARIRTDVALEGLDLAVRAPEPDEALDRELAALGLGTGSRRRLAAALRRWHAAAADARAPS